MFKTPKRNLLDLKHHHMIVSKVTEKTVTEALAMPL